MLIIYFVVFILVAPTIHPEVTDETQNVGEMSFFACQITGEPVPTINWYFNGVLLVNGMEHMILVIVISQAGVGYHCYYTSLRAKPEVEC